MVNHNLVTFFIAIFQTKHISTVKFHMGLKNMSFPLIPKSYRGFLFCFVLFCFFKSEKSNQAPLNKLSVQHLANSLDDA